MPTTDRLLLISDDLTGALDTAVQFSRAGVSTFVATQEEAAIPDVDATVLAVDIESRHLPAAEAAGRVQRCVHAAGRAGIRMFYKKTDSTLRGNVGAELAALLRATGAAELYFVPALPEAGRITRGGVQYVDGRPLDRSRYSRDAADPVREASVGALINSQADVAVVCLPAGADPAGPLAHARRPAIVVYDAETNDDLAAIAAQLAAFGPPPLLAGCSGFASMVPGLLGLPRQHIRAPLLRPPLMVVCGSSNEVSRSQVREAEAHRRPALVTLAAGDPIDAVARRLAREGCRDRGDDLLRPPPAKSSSRSSTRSGLARSRSSAGTPHSASSAPWGFAACGRWGKSARGSWYPGWMARRPRPTGMHLVTKAGGFGPVDVVQQIRAALDREA